MDHNVKIPTNSRAKYVYVYFNQKSFSRPWYSGDNPIEGGIAGTFCVLLLCQDNVGNDIALADVSHYCPG